MNVIIVGGGWAGLSAAVELCCRDIDVTVIEAAGQLGGRGRTVHYQGLAVDNGQHLIIGAYHQLLAILDTIGVDQDAVFLRQPLNIIIKNMHGPALQLSPPPCPAPWHLAAAFFTARGMSWPDRWRALRFSHALRQYNGNEDQTVAAVLTRHGQSPSLVERLWTPLCLAMLNTPIDEASFDIFRQALLDSFAHHRRDSDTLFARVDLGMLLPTPCRSYIESRGGTIKLGQRAEKINLDNGRVTSIRLNDGSELAVDQLILATPPFASRRLLAPHDVFSSLVQQLDSFSYAPICTVYLQFPSSVKLEHAMIGVSGTLIQWVFDRRLYQQPGLMAVVISGGGEHMAWSNEMLITTVKKELAGLFPGWPEPSREFVLREKRATFASHAGINRLRPDCDTAVRNCWLAGDYTNTAYPATLEGAVRSGVQCAARVAEQAR